MASLSQAKTLGGVGSILVILAIVPSVGGILAIAGFVLILVAVKNIADVSKNKAIFNSMLISTILAIVGFSVGIFVIIGSALAAFSNLFPGGIPFSSLPGVLPENISTGSLISVIVGVLIGLAIIWVFLIISAIFLRRSYSKIAAYLNIKMFNTAGLLYLIGAALTIVLVWFLILFVAEILQIIAFFSIPDQPPMPPAIVSPSPIATTG